MSDWLTTMKAKGDYFVCGDRINEKTRKMEPAHGDWSNKFLSHPLVMQAEAEGWAKELRQHLMQAARRCYMSGKEPDVDSLMPDEQWCNNAAIQAERMRAGEEWRERNFLRRKA